MRKTIAIVCALALTGCASTDYALYAETQVNIARANAAAEAVKYQTLARIAETGDPTARVVAALSLAGLGSQGQAQKPQLAAPRSFSDYALQWTGLLLPTFGQLYAVNSQTRVALRQSDNSTALGIAQANSNRDIQTATVTGFSNMASLGFKATTDIATVGFKATSDIAANIKQPQPNITISGTGIVGGGTLTTTTNTMSNSTGVLGTGSYATDYRPSTSTSTSTSSTTSTSTSTSTSSSLTCTTGPC